MQHQTVELSGFAHAPAVQVNSPFIKDNNNDGSRITEHVQYKPVVQRQPDGTLNVTVAPASKHLIKTDTRAPKRLGLMLVGWGGNNGSTLTASLLAHQHQLTWETRRGVQAPTHLGSLILASCAHVGVDEQGKDVHVPLFQLAPFARPEDVVVGGWDISGMCLGDALDRSQVLEPTLKQQLKPLMSQMKPLPSYYDPSFIASNQRDRADNILKEGNKQAVLDRLVQDIREFKRGVDKVVILWTANTERYTVLEENVHYRGKDFMEAIRRNHSEISPSSLFATAAILEGCLFINGSPQNTLIPAVVDLAAQRNVPVAGDDFKSGQTKLKSVLVDFLVSSGIRPLSIVSYNHLGNNDGKNLAEAAQFRSKEISKSSVCDDIYATNPLIMTQTTSPQTSPNSVADSVERNVEVDHRKVDHQKVDHRKVDHRIVIEYVPSVGDSKRAMDEYECEIFMGGRQTFSMHNVCEDSLLAAPLMLDLVLLGELLTRVQLSKDDGREWSGMGPCLSLLSFMLKAPMVPEGAPVVNALAKQRRAIEGLLKAIAGLPLIDDLDLQSRF